MQRLRKAAGRMTRPLAVAAGPMTVADPDAGAARSAVSSCVAWYLCAMGDVYARSVAEQGHGQAVRAILAANPRPSPHRSVVPREAEVVLDQYTAHGTAMQVEEQLEPWDHSVDILMLGLPPGLPWHSIEATLRAAAPGSLRRSP
jgi:alkanesulfonate monooxygenase SsuD/methylene tetrahydromethanopterin reductase-like flavin-dependent oxidoreductase (luciferase family)